MKVQRFQDLIGWQKARSFTKVIYGLTAEPPFSRDFGLKNQIQRAAVSVMSNIAEGFDRNRLTEFHQFLSVAKSSCAETRSLLYVAFDVGYVTESIFRATLEQGEEIARILGGLRASIQRKMED